ncbi:MAG: heme iron utilization protein [Pseudomonadales bacterium]|nr:heme iron utilization protein [Pseudomonadales bacterium]
MMTTGQMTTGQQARQALQSCFSGVLSTLSQKFSGYPFGSVVPFCLDLSGRPLILISRLAQHTRNIAAHPQLSLTLLASDPAQGDVQQNERLTLLADAEPVADSEAAATIYYRCFPQASGYQKQLDFEFYCLYPVQLRYIQGFGQARWLSPGEVIRPNPFSAEQWAGIVDHMNEDHRDAITHYCQLAGLPGGAENASMAGIDGEGMTLRVNRRLHRVEFAQNVTTSEQARAILVEMARTSLTTDSTTTAAT